MSIGCNFKISFFILFSFCLKLCFGITYRTLPTPMPTPDELIYNPKVKSKTCLLRPKEGPCRAEIEMYYFDPENMHCKTFIWGGCQGNGNRFDKEQECLDFCLTRKTDPKIQPAYCRLEFDYGYCFGAAPRWFYDRRSKTCKKGIYSGCGGNKNHFYTQEACENKCIYLLDEKITANDATDATTAASEVTSSMVTEKSTNRIELMGRLP